MVKFVAVGECMLELRSDGDSWQLGHAGDTFNTAVYLARLGEEVSFLTALGDDPFSSAMRTAWAAEGLHLDLVLTAPQRLPGLYAIRTDPDGERSFHYWRTQAAVRDLFRLPGCDAALERAASAQLLYISGITLALFGASDRAELKMLAERVRAGGGLVAFDPNYRPALWLAPEAAREAIADFSSVVTIALPTFEDEALLHGDRDPHATHARWRAAGAGEIVIKLGARGCMLQDGRTVAPPVALQPIDTTGAGDAFNAGYLAARLRGSSALEAGSFANVLAGRVTRCSGAILPRAEMPTLLPAKAGTGAEAEGKEWAALTAVSR